MTMFEDRVHPSDPPDYIRTRIEELKAMLELATEDFERLSIEAEIRWSERVLERTKFVVHAEDGSYYYTDSPE